MKLLYIVPMKLAKPQAWYKIYWIMKCRETRPRCYIHPPPFLSSMAQRLHICVSSNITVMRLRVIYKKI